MRWVVIPGRTLSWASLSSSHLMRQLSSETTVRPVPQWVLTVLVALHPTGVVELCSYLPPALTDDDGKKFSLLREIDFGNQVWRAPTATAQS